MQTYSFELSDFDIAEQPRGTRVWERTGREGQFEYRDATTVVVY